MELDNLIRCDQNQLKSVSEDSWKYEIKTVCMHCDENFPDYWTLRDHLKVHDKRSFYCSLCNAAFSCRSNCIAHIMQKHGLTDREEANEKVRYEPGDLTKNPRPKQPPGLGVKTKVLSPNSSSQELHNIHYDFFRERVVYLYYTENDSIAQIGHHVLQN